MRILVYCIYYIAYYNKYKFKQNFVRWIDINYDVHIIYMYFMYNKLDNFWHGRDVVDLCCM